jgi:inhibitor of Bruton tyrosine kinase
MPQIQDKRSLKDIQEEEQARRQEEEFMRWWAAEEERVRAENAAIEALSTQGSSRPRSQKKPRRQRKPTPSTK